LAATLAAAALIVAPMVGASAANAAEPSSKVLKVAITSDIDTLNPFTAILGSSTGILALQYQSLTAYSAKDNSVVPGAASKWKTSNGGKTWTFTMPSDRVWSDGKPMTAKDAAWTFEAIKKNKKLQQANGSLLENVTSVSAKNDTTLVVSLKAAQAPNPGAELPIVPEHIWAKVKNPATFANDKNDVGSGPFVVSSYQQGQSVTLKANSHFWRGAPKIDGITYVYYKNGDAAVQGLKTGEVDVVSGLEPAQYQALKGQKGITVNAGAGRRYTSVAINPGAKDADGKPLGDGNPALQDPVLRKAIVMAIDNKTLLTKVQQGLGTLGTGEVPPVYPTFALPASARTMTFDPDAANKMLDTAGYTKGADGIRVDKSGKPLNLRLLGRSSDPTHQQMADYIKPWLKAIGINVTVAMKSDNDVNDESTLGQYDMYFTGWGIGPDPDFQLSINQCSSRPNADGSGALSESNWCSAAFDKLYTQQHTELDATKRASLVKDAQEVIYKAAVNDVIWYAQSLEAYRSDQFTGFVKQPEKGGVITGQNGYWGFYSATPVGGSSSASSVNPAVIIWPIVGVIVVAGIIVLIVMRRRRTTADQRE
jgi:peptide/nickel transport system substrate-binding protein